MKYFFTILLSFSCTIVFSQSKIFVYYFDSELNPAPKSKAKIIGRGMRTENGVKVSLSNIQTKKVFNVRDYTDSSLAVLNGKSIDYYDNGKTKILETFSNNFRNGVTIKWDSSGLITDSVLYANDKLQTKTRFEYDFSGRISRKVFTDSIQNTMNDIFYSTNGKKISEVNFKGNKGIWKYFNTDGSVSKTEEVLTRERKDATFPGGEEAWKDYLAKELNATIAFENKAPEGEYVVLVSFTVDKAGTISNIQPMTKQGFGMEEESVRVIQKSGKWTPATVYGKIIKSHRLQAVQFVVTKSI